jgi:SAM-dependent methyltransferase
MAYIFQTARVELFKQIEKFSGKVSGRVLDIGSRGPGKYRKVFSYDSYTTLDIVSGNGIDVIGSIESLPFPDCSFDSIVCTQVIGDVYDLKKAFHECYRILSKNGYLILSESLFDSLHDEPNDYWRFTSHSLRKLTEDSGFFVEVIESRGGFWSVRAQMLIRYLIERFDIYNKWYRRPFNIFFTIYGKWMLFLDKYDKSNARNMFTHGYILVARK